jgi:hypothetical protein
MRSFRSVYFEQAYSLLSQFIDESGRQDEKLIGYLEDRDVEGLVSWADSHKGDALSGPIRLFASGIVLDETLDKLAASAEQLRETSKDALNQSVAYPSPKPSISEQALLLLANTPSSQWIH